MCVLLCGTCVGDTVLCRQRSLDGGLVVPEDTSPEGSLMVDMDITPLPSPGGEYLSLLLLMVSCVGLTGTVSPRCPPREVSTSLCCC